MMKEGDCLFETGVGELLDGSFCWRARGADLAEYCSIHEPDWLPIVDPEGWLNVGPFKTARAAARDLKKFEADYHEFLQAKYPDLELRDASNPRALN